MINFFPVLYEDELLYSQLARCYVQLGYSRYQHIAKELFTDKKSKPNILFINKYNEYGKQLITRNISLNDIIFKHTMFPFYARFYPLKQRVTMYEYFAKMKRDKGKNIIRYNTTQDLKYLRYCPICANADRKKYGETYWHRIHQLQGVNICPIHNCYLINGKVSLDYNLSACYITAEESVPKLINNLVNICDNKIEIKLAKYISEVFLSEMDMQANMSTNYLFYHKLLSTKYVTNNGKIKYLTLLHSDFIKYYSSLPTIQITSNNIQRIFSRYNYNIINICMMALFLDISVDTVIHANFNNPLKKNKENKSRKKNINWEQIDNKMLPKVKCLIMQYQGDGITKPKRISINAFEKELGLFSKQIYSMPQCKKAIEDNIISLNEYWALKIIWAVNKIKRDKMDLNSTNIQRLTNIKKPSILRSLKYVSKYANKELENEIIAVVPFKNAK